MFLKSLVLSFVVVVAGFASGIGMFFWLNSDEVGEPVQAAFALGNEWRAATQSDLVKFQRSITPSGQWLGTASADKSEAQQKTAIVNPPKPQTAWRTQVHCPEGDEMATGETCEEQRAAKVAASGEAEAVKRTSDTDDSRVIGKFETAVETKVRQNSPAMPGRMTLGGPSGF